MSRAATILVAVVAVATLASAVLTESAIDDARSFLDDGIDEDTFLEAYAPVLLMQFVQLAATIASAVLVMIFMHRMAGNHRTLHRGGTWGPGWAIGSWFLPPGTLYVLPFLMFRELWKASDPDTPVGADWRSNQVSPIVPIWWVLYGIIPLVITVLQGLDAVTNFGADADDLAEAMIDQRGITWLNAAVTVAAAVAFAVMARGLADRHRRLIGEAPA